MTLLLLLLFVVVIFYWALRHLTRYEFDDYEDHDYWRDQ